MVNEKSGSAIQRLAVVGAGNMGAGIAQAAAQSGMDVTLMDVSRERLDKGMAEIEKTL